MDTFDEVITELRREGASLRAIAEAVGSSKSAVQMRLATLGVPAPDEVKAWRADGSTYTWRRLRGVVDAEAVESLRLRLATYGDGQGQA